MGLNTPLQPFSQPEIFVARHLLFGAVNPSVNPVVVSALTATPGLGQVILNWAVSDPSGVNAATELWMSARVNDRSLASHMGETAAPGTTRRHIISPQEPPFFYWIRARDVSGNVGPWFPTGENSGVEADFSLSATRNGFWQHPSGFIEQYGYVDPPVGTGFISFPITFPNLCLNIETTLAASGSNRTVAVGSFNNGTFLAVITDGDGTPQTASFFWRAIGY